MGFSPEIKNSSQPSKPNGKKANGNGSSANQSQSDTEDKASLPLDEWAGLEPTDKNMGLVQFTLDKGVKTTVVGTVYGMSFDIEGDGYKAEVFFDHYSKRLKIQDYEAENYTAMMHRMAWLAQANGFDKIFAKVPKEDVHVYLAHNYTLEGVLRYYFRGEDAYVLSRFSTLERVTSDDLVEEARLIEELNNISKPCSIRTLDPNISIVRATRDHIPQMAALYRNSFKTYPSPLTSPDYIQSTMDQNLIYRLAIENGKILAAASVDMNRKHSNAEMTDCATIPEAQGKGLMQHLLTCLEDDLKEEGIMTAYTLARGTSIGMNRTFFKLGYAFTGRLINNCDISGRFEDMNIWVKPLTKG